MSVVFYVSCSFLSVSLSPNIFDLFSPARSFTRSHPAELRHPDDNAHFSHVFFEMKLQMTGLYFSELSDQLDVTLESSKIVKLALTWVVTTQRDTIKQRS